jgi:hypothetical protein
MRMTRLKTFPRLWKAELDAIKAADITACIGARQANRSERDQHASVGMVINAGAVLLVLLRLMHNSGLSVPLNSAVRFRPMAIGKPHSWRGVSMIRLLNVLILGGVLTFPFAARAQDRRDQQPGHEQASGRGDRQQTKRYYDKSSRDYHQWNQDEDRRYHEYLRERHMKDRDFGRLNGRQQSDYFKWSHEHDSAQHHEDNHR